MVFIMIDTKQIFLVTHDFEDGDFEVTTLHLWIKTDQNIYLRDDRKRKLSWVILAAYDSRSEAQNHCDRLKDEKAT